MSARCVQNTDVPLREYSRMAERSAAYAVCPIARSRRQESGSVLNRNHSPPELSVVIGCIFRLHEATFNA
jgi:hypothetical protein